MTGGILFVPVLGLLVLHPTSVPVFERVNLRVERRHHLAVLLLQPGDVSLQPDDPVVRVDVLCRPHLLERDLDISL